MYENILLIFLGKFCRDVKTSQQSAESTQPVANSRTTPTSTAVQNPIPVSNVQPITSTLDQSMTAALVQSMTAARPIPVGQPVSDMQYTVTGTGPRVRGMASAQPGSTVPPTSSNVSGLQPGPPAAPSFWSLLNSTSSDFAALKERMSLVAPQTSPTYTRPEGLCHDNTLVMVRITTLNIFTFKEKRMTDIN